MNVKETILDQHKTILRIEKLQEEMHELVIASAFAEEYGFVEFDTETKISFTTMHILSHVIEDVLNGADPKQALQQSFILDENEE